MLGDSTMFTEEELSLYEEWPDILTAWDVQGCISPQVEPYKIGSFEDYCRRHFGLSWLRELKRMIEGGAVPLGRHSEAVPRPDDIRVIDMKIVRIRFTRTGSKTFHAESVVSAEINIKQHTGAAILEDIMTQWYSDCYIFTVDGNTYSVQGDKTGIFDSGKRCPGVPLSEYLVPVLDNWGKEMEAEEMLHCFYPEALAEPCRIDAMLLARRMGLKVVELPLCPERAVMGRAVFYPGKVRILSGTAGETEEAAVGPGTIIINRRCAMNDTQKNSTVIHECIHHYEHGLFAWAQAVYGDDVIGIECPVVCKDKKSPVFWCEQQARMITYRLKMNRIQTGRKYCEIKKGIRKKYPRLSTGKVLEKTIGELALFFDSSKECVKKRLLEIGFGEVEGVLNYVNGQYVPPFFSAPGITEGGKTFIIGFKEAVAEYARNQRFRGLLDSGHYVYAEGKFCQNKPEYVYRDSSGRLCLTQRARLHVETCCLLFEYAYGDSDIRYSPGSLDRERSTADENGRKIVAPFNAAEPGSFNPEDFLQEAAWITSVCKKISGLDFDEALVFLMEERKCTVEMLEEKSWISERTIKRLRREKGYNVTWNHIVALSVGLNLPPRISEVLFEAAGLRLKNDVRHNVYRMILDTFYASDISTVNDMLVRMKMGPLTVMAKAV